MKEYRTFYYGFQILLVNICKLIVSVGISQNDEAVGKWHRSADPSADGL